MARIKVMPCGHCGHNAEPVYYTKPHSRKSTTTYKIQCGNDKCEKHPETPFCETILEAVNRWNIQNTSTAPKTCNGSRG